MLCRYSIVAGAAAIFSNIEQLSLVEIQELLWVGHAPAPTELEELFQGCNHDRGPTHICYPV